MLTEDDKIKICNKMYPYIHDDIFPTAGDFKLDKKIFKSFAKYLFSQLFGISIF